MMKTFLPGFTPYSFPLLGWVRLPSVTISDEDKIAVGLKPTATNLEFLKKLCWQAYLDQAAKGKFEGISREQVVERLKFECSVLDKTGTIDYILLVWDLIRWCDKNGIPRGPGRGSVCGSLVCFLAAITKINSLRYNLNFTRFISEARVKPKQIDGIWYADGRAMCDIDCDFSIVRKRDIQAYIDEKYPNRNAKIGNFFVLTGKVAIKEVLKTFYEMEEQEAMRVSDLLENHFGKGEKLSSAAEKNKEYKAWIESDPKHKKAHILAMSVEGLLSHKGVHASGLFLSYDVLDKTLPVERTIDRKTKEECITTVYDMDLVAKLGVKLDELSLKTLDVIKEACRLIGITEDDIDVDHVSIYDFLAASRLYYGAFQIESGLAGDVTFKAKPRDLKQLAATISIARPGSLSQIPTLIEYFQEGKLKSIHPQFDEILKDTANVIIYQESINEICQRVYGLSAVDADEVRRAISKKKREDIAKWEPVIFAAGESKGIPKEVTSTFWSTCNASADYLFSYNHALPYSVLTAQTIYLKANYTKEFYLATLRFAKKDEISLIIGEAAKLGVRILPPNLAKSQDDFVFEGNDIRFGLKHIKGIAEANLAKVSSFRRDFRDKFEVFEFAKSLGLQINIVETLFWSGALSLDDSSRLKLAMEARAYNLMCDTMKNTVSRFAMDYGYDLMETIRALKEMKNEKGKPMLATKQLDTFRKNFEPFWTAYQKNIKYEDLFNYLAERAHLGFSYSNTLHNLYSKKVPDLKPVNDVFEEPKGIQVSFVAFVDEVKSGEGKTSKKKYVRFEVSDESGKIKAMLNGNKIEGCEQFNGRLPEKNDVVIIHGTKADTKDMVFANNVIIQPVPVSLKKGREADAPAQL